MKKMGWSNSDLARAVWGETTDTKGYKVARNRDRIAVYRRGAGFPEPSTLHKIAEVLGVAKDELAPELMAAAIDREHPEFSMTTVGEHMQVQMNALLPPSIAAEISKLYAQAKAMVTRQALKGNSAEAREINDDGMA